MNRAYQKEKSFGQNIFLIGGVRRLLDKRESGQAAKISRVSAIVFFEPKKTENAIGDWLSEKIFSTSRKFWTRLLDKRLNIFRMTQDLIDEPGQSFF